MGAVDLLRGNGNCIWMDSSEIAIDGSGRLHARRVQRRLVPLPAPLSVRHRESRYLQASAHREARSEFPAAVRQDILTGPQIRSCWYA